MSRLLAVLLAIGLLLHPSPAAAVGGPSNIVMAVNHSDGRLAIRSNIQVMREPGMIVAPQNFAFATASCTDCQTVAVALQLNFANAEAGYIAPQNVAVASNEACTRCTTIALAYQFFFTVEDATATPDGVREIMRDLDAELREVSADSTITLEEAQTRIVIVIQRFTAYATAFDEQRSAIEE